MPAFELIVQLIIRILGFTTDITLILTIGTIMLVLAIGISGGLFVGTIIATALYVLDWLTGSKQQRIEYADDE